MVAHLIEAGNIDALDLRGLHEKIVLAPALELGLPQEGQQLVVDLFPLTDHKEIEEGGHRLGVHAGCPARPDKGQQPGPIG